MACLNVDEFRKIHNEQLKRIDFPIELIQTLFNILNSDEDQANHADVLEIQTPSSSRPILIAKKYIPKKSCCYLIDHIWTSDGSSKCAQQLHKSTDLAETLRKIFNVPEMSNVEECYDYSNQTEIVKSVAKTNTEQAAKALNEYHGNTIESVEKCLDKDTPDLPKQSEVKEKISYDEFVSGLVTTGNMPENASEDFLRKMYENFDKHQSGSGTTLTYNWQDEDDVVSVYVPIPIGAKKNAIKSTLTPTSWKLVVNDKEVINGNLSHSVKTDDSFWSIEKPGVMCMTFEKVIPSHTWELLLKNEIKLSSETIVQTAWAKRKFEEIYYNELLDTMWKFNQTYSVAPQVGQAAVPQWYIMDKLGSALTHSSKPNFKCSPFIYSALGRAYNIMWPIKDIPEGAMCTRDFIPQIVANESLDMCKIRLKAFTEKKLYENQQPEEKEKETVSSLDDFNVETMSFNEIPKTGANVKVSLGIYSDLLDKNVASKLHVTLAKGGAQDATISLKTLNKTSIDIEGNILPTSEMLANVEYCQNYLQYHFGEVEWYENNHILPAGLVDFNKEVEKTDLLQYWLVKPLDKRLIQLETFVTSQLTRTIRTCEVGSIAVSKYIINQLPFRSHLWSLSYPMFICPATKCVYIYKEPCMRMSKEKLVENIDEYKTDSTITEPLTGLVSAQTADTFSDFKIAMNKLLLPIKPDQGWSYVEEKIFKVLAKVGKAFAGDLRLPQVGGCKSYVFFNIDVIVDDVLTPRIVDINGEGTLSSKLCLTDALTIALGGSKDTFVTVK